MNVGGGGCEEVAPRHVAWLWCNDGVGAIEPHHGGNQLAITAMHGQCHAHTLGSTDPSYLTRLIPQVIAAGFTT